jgi:hypothetical protein
MKPEDEAHDEGSGGSRDERRGGAMMRSYNLARMSGMLDLARDENAKHFLPR